MSAVTLLGLALLFHAVVLWSVHKRVERLEKR